VLNQPGTGEYEMIFKRWNERITRLEGTIENLRGRLSVLECEHKFVSEKFWGTQYVTPYPYTATQAWIYQKKCKHCGKTITVNKSEYIEMAKRELDEKKEQLVKEETET
jgi:hypothetical protein